MEPMRGVCISAGARGRGWVNVARKAGVDVVGLVDIDRAKLDEAGEEVGIPPEARFTSITEAAHATGATFAEACTPHSAHAAVVTECLNSGMHTIIAKPMAEAMEDARRMVALAEEKGLVLAVDQQFRFTAGILLLRDAVQSGSVGELAAVSIQFAKYRPCEGMALPLMLNQLIHELDAARFILGREPLSVMARSWNPPWHECSGPSMLEAVYLLEGGAVMHVSGSYTMRVRRTDWRIEGSGGQLAYNGKYENGRYSIIRRPSSGGEEIVAAPASNATVELCRDVLAAIREGRAPRTGGRDNLKSLAMIFAAQKSSDTGREVKISEV